MTALGGQSRGVTAFVEVPAPTVEALQRVLHKITTRLMTLPTRRGALVEEEMTTCMVDNDGDADAARVIRPLQAAPGRRPGSISATLFVLSLASFRNRLATTARGLLPAAIPRTMHP